MKVLHLLNDGHSVLVDEMIRLQSGDHEVQVIDLSQDAGDYEGIIRAIFSSDRVISW